VLRPDTWQLSLSKRWHTEKYQQPLLPRLESGVRDGQNMIDASILNEVLETWISRCSAQVQPTKQLCGTKLSVKAVSIQLNSWCERIR